MSNFSSSYWYRGGLFDTKKDTETSGRNLYQLAAAKRAIGNFVSILVPDQRIPVNFSTNNSYTDGNEVVIAASVTNPTFFDSSVGLALHEASHIKLSDFEVLKDLQMNRRKFDDKFTKARELKVKARELNIDADKFYSLLKNMINVVEDRRIDNYIFTKAPGYRDYYRAMYDRYFNDTVITKALRSNEYTEVNMDSYMFRFINLHSEGSRLNALPGLREIYKIVNLSDIGRLESTDEAIEVALDVFEVILRELKPQPNESESDETTSGKGEEGDGDPVDSQSDSNDESGSGDGKGKSDLKPDEDADTTSSGKSEAGGTDSDVPELTEKQKERMSRLIEKQEQFLDHDVPKGKLNQSELDSVNTIEEASSEIKEVDFEDRYGGTSTVNCVVIHKVNETVMKDSNVFPFYSSWRGREDGTGQEVVANGMRIGKRLLNKLQIRSEERVTEYTRQKSGRIDHRLLSGLGAGNHSVFYTKEVDSYNEANLHISIDASGSMHGKEWDQAMTTAVALITAIDKMRGMNIQVSIRGTLNTKEHNPVVAIIYDSRKDKISKVKNIFPHLEPNGTTPEGLTFQSIMKEFIGGGGNMDSYFVNISDGMPYYGNATCQYSGDSALRHTANQVKSIREMGINVLSYYVTSGYSDGPMEASESFKTMYGKTAKAIDMASVTKIAQTMNELFLQK